ncbi:hypothetical protein U9M48_019904 [Paspalum notatum var. saurae]|uniref:Polygalacturonase n=1 Tax=Paspalum notatum var. saurae TaxID=547442 RepID=A0AAQ3WRZ1_PASNO
MRLPVTSTRLHWRRPVPLAAAVISVALLSLLCLAAAADASKALHYHRKHRRQHHRHHRAENDDSHISLPPAALPPDVVDGDPPAEPPGLPPDAGGKPPQSSRHDKPPATTLLRAKAPSLPPAKPPAFSLALPPARAPAAGTAPSHPHANPPSLRPVQPPTNPRAKAPSLSPARPPASSLARPPALAPAVAPHHSQAKTPSSYTKRASAPSPFSPSKPPSSSPSHVEPPPCTLPQPPQARTPRLAPAKPPMRSPAAQPPKFSPPASPPAHPPAMAPKKAPTGPPALSPAKAQPPVPLTVELKPPRLAPAKPPTPSPSQPPRPSKPVNPSVPPTASAKPPAALPPATPKPIPPPPPAAKNCSSPTAMGNAVFDVRSFGASGNGGSGNDTRAFRAAWKAACSSDSAAATLLVPSDGVFTINSTIFAGPCKPSLTFQIDGVLMPPDGPASWPATDSRKQWVVFYKVDGMTLAGKGTIEGNGEAWWDLPCKPHRGPNGSTLPGPCDSPALLRFFLSDDVTVRDLRIENSPQFHLKFDGCRRVRVDGLVVSSPAFSPNTDGVHVENTTSVHILNSRIYNGDDCVSIGAGCSDVHIDNITCGHGHGISIGSLGVHNTRACVSNVTVRNARIIDSDNGVRIKTWQGGAGAVSAVEFAGVQMRNVKNCIVIDQYYCLGSGCANQTSAVRVAGVAYRDIRGTYNPQAGAPIRLACSDAVACTDITMSAVELLPAGGGPGATMLADPYCWNAYGVMETLTLPPVYCLLEGRPESLQDQLSSC